MKQIETAWTFFGLQGVLGDKLRLEPADLQQHRETLQQHAKQRCCTVFVAASTPCSRGVAASITMALAPRRQARRALVTEAPAPSGTGARREAVDRISGRAQREPRLARDHSP
jgi:hypothetical protein